MRLVEGIFFLIDGLFGLVCFGAAIYFWEKGQTDRAIILAILGQTLINAGKLVYIKRATEIAN